VGGGWEELLHRSQGQEFDCICLVLASLQVAVARSHLCPQQAWVCHAQGGSQGVTREEMKEPGGVSAGTSRSLLLWLSYTSSCGCPQGVPPSSHPVRCELDHCPTPGDVTSLSSLDKGCHSYGTSPTSEQHGFCRALAWASRRPQEGVPENLVPIPVLDTWFIQALPVLPALRAANSPGPRSK
jgi:hypothetical protein